MVGLVVSRTTFSGRLGANLIRMVALSMISGRSRIPSGGRQSPAGYQQKSQKRASDNYKISRCGQLIALLI
jgi:hypothetical protein